MSYTELDVFNEIRHFLQQNGHTILQLVPPGGQAPLSVTFFDGLRRRTCFPDLLTVENDHIWVGELKPGVSASDYRKVQLLLQRAKGEIFALVASRVDGFDGDSSIGGVLCHADATAPRLPHLHQWVCDGGEVLHLLPS